MMYPQPHERRRMRLEHRLLLLWLLLLAVAIFASAVECERPDTALWLARSCVGEAGFGAHETGECLAIAHVYAKRSSITGRSYYSTMRAYSAAIKPRSNKNNPWVLQLNVDATRPRGWPHGLDWDNYRSDWMATLQLARQFLSPDRQPDPLPTATHYGGWVDRHRIPGHWVRIPTPYRNRFYNTSGGRGK